MTPPAPGACTCIIRVGFPPLDQPLGLLAWFVDAHTGRMFAYPVGGARGASALTTVCFLAALTMLWRQRRREVLVMCLGCFGLALLAAAVQKYPYGTGTRLMLYLSPLICLMAGLGAAGLLARLSASRHRHGVAAALASLLLVAVAGLTRDLTQPHKTPHDREKREFDRWFWQAQAYRGEVVCTLTDLQLDFYADRLAYHSAVYRCNQKIYSPRHAVGANPRWGQVSQQRPLRCVIPNPPDCSPNPQMLADWLRDMEARYRLTAKHSYEVNAGAGTVYSQRYDVYEFVPHGQSTAVAGRSPGGSPPR